MNIAPNNISKRVKFLPRKYKSFDHTRTIYRFTNKLQYPEIFPSISLKHYHVPLLSFTIGNIYISLVTIYV